MLPVEHDCEINVKPEEIYFLPFGGRCRKLWLTFRRAFMASTKNSSAQRYLKTHGAIIHEKRRHLRNFRSIIHPFSMFRHWWDFAMILSMIAMTLLVPYQAAFDITREASPHWTVTKNSLLCLFMLDILVNFSTGYFDSTLRQVEMDRSLISRRYALRGTFIPDLLGSLPTDVFFLGRWNDRQVAREIASLIYAFRLISARVYIARMLDARDTTRTTFDLVSAMIGLLVALHWLTGVTWLVPIAASSLGGRNVSWTSVDQRSVDDRQVAYWSSWCRSVAILSRSGFLGPEPAAPEDQILAAATQLAGVAAFALVTALAARRFAASDASRLRYRATVAQLQQYMRHKQLPRAVQRRFVAYYEFRYQRRYFREPEILDTVSSRMRQEIGMHSCRRLVESVTFFDNLPAILLARIVALLKSEIFLTNDVIVRANQPGDCMYFIASGTVAIYARGGREVCHLEDGAHFGEIALVMPDARRVASVVAVEVCELYRLERADFARTVHPYPMLWERIRKIAVQRHEKTAIIDAR